MIYIKKLILPSANAEIKVIKDEKRTCFNTFYPFKIFPEKCLREVEFDSVTLLYGGNGSGKSTLINVLAGRLNANRYSEFNASPFFEQFVGMCELEYGRMPRISSVLTSDDVFRYVLNARRVNESLGDDRDELMRKYVEVRSEAERNPEIMRMNGLDDYERWKTTMEILSPRRSQSSYIRKRVASDIDLMSNGETAMRYFVDRTEEEGLYLLDEPENSLSIEHQIRLAEYIEATARATRTQFVIATHSPILLSMKNVRIYNLDDYPVSVCRWTELPNVRRYFDFFMSHKDEFN